MDEDGGDRRGEIRRALEALVGPPATEGNRVDVLTNGDEIFPAMLAAIRGGRRSVDLLTFIMGPGEVTGQFAAALSERASAGVRVRVAVDELGGSSAEPAALRRMRSAGVELAWVRPRLQAKFWHAAYRCHRRALVVDGRVGFTGGVGIAEEWSGDARGPGEWRDTHFRVEGPAVRGLQATFADTWLEATGDLDVDGDFPPLPRAGDTPVQVVRGASEVGINDVAALLRAAVGLARERLRISTAYFVPDESACGQLVAAVARGVKVDVLVPGAHVDQRLGQLAGEKEYAPLLEAGVRIWRYLPSMLHAKVLTVDSLFAVVGTANFDARSTAVDEEVVLVVHDPEVTRRLERQFHDDLAASELTTRESWRRRPFRDRLAAKLTETIDELT